MNNGKLKGTRYDRLLLVRFKWLVPSSPRLAQLAGELAGNIVNLCFMRLYDFFDKPPA